MATGQWDEVAFTPKGPAGIFAVYVPVGSNLGNVFVNEFVCVGITFTTMKQLNDCICRIL